MKKILSIVLVFIAIVSLTACKKTNNELTQSTVPQKEKELMEEFLGGMNGSGKEIGLSGEFIEDKKTVNLNLTNDNIDDLKTFEEPTINVSKKILDLIGKGYKVNFFVNNDLDNIIFSVEDGILIEDNSKKIENELKIKSNTNGENNNYMENLNEDTVSALATKTFPNAILKNIIINDGIVNIQYYYENNLNAKTTVNVNARRTLDFLEAIFKNPEVKKVSLYEQGILIDPKGNEVIQNIIGFDTDRETIQDVNWENMRMMVAKDYNNMNNISTNYDIRPVLKKDLKK